MSDAAAFKKISTPMELRLLAKKSVASWADLIVGTPKTGPVHRPIWVDRGDNAPVKCEIIEPIGTAPFPVMLFVHGGGWVMGDLDTHHQVALRFAEQGFVVVALEYALAPEHPFPAGYDDIVAVAHWIIANIPKYNGDPARFVIAGDSAGANLGAGVAVNEADLPIRATALVYGVYDLAALPSMPVIHADDYLQNMHEGYLGKGNLHLLNDSRVSPLFAADKLPPTIVAVGTADPLHEESNQIVGRLQKFGLTHEYIVLEGAQHGFLHMENQPDTLLTIGRISKFLLAHAQ